MMIFLKIILPFSNYLRNYFSIPKKNYIFRNQGPEFYPYEKKILMLVNPLCIVFMF